MARVTLIILMMRRIVFPLFIFYCTTKWLQCIYIPVETDIPTSVPDVSYLHFMVASWANICGPYDSGDCVLAHNYSADVADVLSPTNESY